MSSHIITLLAVAALSLASFACSQKEPAPSVSNALQRTLDNAAADLVNIGELAVFDWDQLYIFGPYASPSFICERLGYDKPKCEDANFPQVGEGESLLVFLRRDNAVRKETLSVRVAGFDRQDLARPITRAKAVFVIKRVTGGAVLSCKECRP